MPSRTIEHVSPQQAREVNEKAIERLRRPDRLERLHAAQELIPERVDEHERIVVRAGLRQVQLNALVDGVDAAPEILLRRQDAGLEARHKPMIDAGRQRVCDDARMPSALLRSCTTPGCPNLSPRRRWQQMKFPNSRIFHQERHAS